MSTIQQLLIKGYEKLKNSNIDTYQIDCQVLLCKVLNKDRLYITLNKEELIGEKEEDLFFKLVHKRAAKVPVKYLTRECEFMGIEFFIKEGVLIPRGDTEILVEAALKDIDRYNYKKVCDVCCGSGAIGLSIAKISKVSEVMLYDIASTAIEVTSINIERLNLKERAKVLKSDLLKEAIKAKKSFDIIVSNPPYIKEEVIPTLMEDVKNYEPYIALSGGKDGLEFYRKITASAVDLLVEGGTLAFEIGYDQKNEVMSIMESYNFKNIECIKDLAGKDRVVKGILGCIN